MTIRELYLKYVSQYYNFQWDLKCYKVFFGKEASEYFRKQLQTVFRKNAFVELEIIADNCFGSIFGRSHSQTIHKNTTTRVISSRIKKLGLFRTFLSFLRLSKEEEPNQKRAGDVRSVLRESSANQSKYHSVFFYTVGLFVESTFVDIFLRGPKQGGLFHSRMKTNLKLLSEYLNRTQL